MIDAILTNTMLPDISREFLNRMMEGRRSNWPGSRPRPVSSSTRSPGRMPELAYQSCSFLHWRPGHHWAGKMENESKYPKTATEEVGDMHFEHLSGELKGQYTVRVDGAKRIAFKFVASGQKKDLVSTVDVLQIGGHYPKMKT